MTQIAIGRELPNLKITLGNDFKSSELSEEGEILDNESDVDASKSQQTEKPVEIYRKFVSPLESFRKYENKGGGFVTGLDLSSESISKKLEERAARFGFENRPQKSITQAEIDALYESLEIDNGNKELSSYKSKNLHIRLDAVHMRGVDDMSTNDIFDYFKEYGPASVEWINDYSCNVVWLDETGAARALLGLSRVLVIQKKSQASFESSKKSEAESNKEDVDIVVNDKAPELEEVIVMSDFSSDDDEEEEDKLVAFKHQKNEDTNVVEKMDVDNVIVSNQKEEVQEYERESNSPDVPVPPGHWRLGVPHTKAKAILLRFASKDDRKLPGAEKRSQYYQKYGNPNYGGMRGLISATRKRKIMATRSKIGVQQLSKKSTNPEATQIFDEALKYAPKPKKTKSLRMRMYADEEEERIIKRGENRKKIIMNNRTSSKKKNRGSIYDRLGKSGSKFDLVDFKVNRIYIRDEDPLRRKKEEEEEEEDDDDDKYNSVKSAIIKPGGNRKIPSRYNVWTHIAKSMAQESDEQDSEEMPSWRRRRNTRKFSTVSQDLRNKLHSPFYSAKRQSDSGEGSDLRSKLDNIRKSTNVSKHRSPLMIEVENNS